MKAVLYDIVQDTVGYEIDFLEDDVPLMQAGIASRQAVTMRASLEQAMPGIKFPATLVFDFPTINSVMDYVEDVI
jgi:acyl carrier protein